MDVAKMLEELREERAMLEEAIIALQKIAAGGGEDKPRRGRPPKSAAVDAPAAAPRSSRKRELSPEGRARIAEAAKRRWAEARQKKDQA